MNIFVLDRNPEQSAKYLADKHVVKMVVESGQMIANAFSLEHLADSTCPKTQKGLPRSHSYLHHPCSKWTLESKDNFLWLCHHGLAIAHEYTLRYGKRHFTEDFLWWAMFRWDSADNINHEHEGLTEFAVAIPETAKAYEIAKTLPDVVDKYRAYYALDKAYLAKWTVRDIPPFMRGTQ